MATINNLSKKRRASDNDYLHIWDTKANIDRRVSVDNFRKTILSDSINILPNKATSNLVNGVYFTVNGDGSVIVDGTATSDINYIICNDLDLIEGNYKFIGSPLGGSSSTYGLELTDGLGLDIIIDDDTFVNVDLDKDSTVIVKIFIRSGCNVDNLEFRPMLTDSDIEDLDYYHYVPYDMSVSELTKYYITVREKLIRGNVIPIDPGIIPTEDGSIWITTS